MNLNGIDEVKGFLGGFVTIALLCVLIIFAADNLLDLIKREYPIVQDMVIADHFTAEDRLKLKDVDYHFAFTFESRD